MSCNLEKMTVKQKIKELVRWQEMQQQSLGTKDQLSPRLFAKDPLKNSKQHATSIVPSLVTEKVDESEMTNFDKINFNPITEEEKPEKFNEKIFSNDEKFIKPKPKRPFLKKGSGLARFRLAPKKFEEHDNSKNRVDSKTTTNYASENKIISTEKTDCSSICINRKESRNSNSNTNISKPSYKLDLRLQPTQEVKTIEQEEIPSWADILHQHSESSSQKEAEELKIFEILEEKVAESSFCSSSSMVTKLMEFSVKSTPKKSIPLKNKLDEKILSKEKQTVIVSVENGDDYTKTCYKNNSKNGNKLEKHNQDDNMKIDEESHTYGDDDKWSCDSSSESDYSSSVDSSVKEISFSPMTNEGQMILSLIAKYKELAYLDRDDFKTSNTILNASITESETSFYHDKLNFNNRDTGPKIVEVTSHYGDENNEKMMTESQSELKQDVCKNLENAKTMNAPVTENDIKIITTNDKEPYTICKENDRNGNIYDSNLQEYIKKIQEELKSLEKETERVISVRSRYEEDFKKFQQEKAAMLKNYENEKRLFEIEVEEERKKLQKEKAVFEKHSKPLRNKPTTLRQETEMKMLQEKVAILQEELKEKQKNWGVSQSSVRAQIHSLVEANKNLKQEILSLKQKEQKESHQKNKTVYPSYKSKPRAPFKSISEHIESLDDALFQPPMVIEDVCLHEDLHVNKKNSAQVTEVPIKVMKDAWFTASTCKVTKNGDIQNGIIEDCTDGIGNTNHINENNTDPLFSSNSAPASSYSKDNPSFLCEKSRNFNKTVEHLSDTMKVVHPNGDEQLKFSDGTVYYYFAETRVWHKKFSDGVEFYVFEDGQVEMRSEDGTYEVVYPNGCRKVFLTSGEEIWHYANGDTVTIKQNGEKVFVFSSGQIEIHRQDYKLRQYPDGSCKFLYANGVTETRYPDGRIRIKDKDGILLKDNKNNLESEKYKLFCGKIDDLSNRPEASCKKDKNYVMSENVSPTC